MKAKAVLIKDGLAWTDHVPGAMTQGKTTQEAR